MFIKAKSYNVPEIELEEAVSVGTNVVGTKKDFDTIMNMVSESGVLQCRATIGDVDLSGSMLCNIAPAGFEAFTITNQGDNLRLILAYCYMDESDFKMDLTVATLS